MFKVVIIGAGNVASHLLHAFNKTTQVDVVQLFSRNKATTIAQSDPLKIVHRYDAIVDADLYIIAVSDGAISAVSSQLPFKNKLVVHSSGSMPLEALDKKNRRGILYPVQTFSKNKAVDFQQIPIGLEAENETDLVFLKNISKIISTSIFEINTRQRKALHVGAVFVNNFVNELYRIGREICIENQVPFETLQPLILETAQKIMTLTPAEAQTGPAIRNDISTIESNIDFLSNENHLTIYKVLTQSIQNHGKKL